MANTLGVLVGPLYEALDVISREGVGFIPAVTKDNGNFARAALGQTVTSFQAPQVTASDIVPGVTAPNDGDQVFTPVNITITKARRVPIRWNGEESAAVNNAGPGQYPMFVNQTVQAMRTLVNEMEQDLILQAVRSGSRATGTPGTAPFGTAADFSDFAAAHRILDDNGAAMVGRRLVVSGAGMQNIRGKQSGLFKVNEAGTDDLLRRGYVGDIEGFKIGYAPQTPLFTAGTGAGYTATGSYAIGATVITVGSGTGTINPGDVVTFAGDPRAYVVDFVNGTVAMGQTPTTITLGAPGLRSTVAGSAAITVGGSYTPNVAFTTDGLLLAARLPYQAPALPGQAEGDMAEDRTVVVDPLSGIAFEVSLYRQYRQNHFEVAVVWGTAGINPAHIAILRG